MKRVLLLSDSHGLTSEITHIKKQVNVDYMVHCGDSELGIDDDQMDGFIKVRGNCDYDSRLPDEQIFEAEKIKFFITHGHLHRVKSGLSTISYRAEELAANVIGFGHTHIAGAEKVGEQLFINPGSIRLPKGIQEKTYAIMEWETADDICVSFYTTDGKCVDHLTYYTSLS
ncbi:metallophosphoesterase [Virgibacillus flavescens]|uniref:metallophosphoesterase n=1 Tax=Virgibacillus flavescens TaxID=1611422 RepID=UPI003D34988D